MRVLVTGVTGFIGSQVARALVRRGDEVHALTDASSSRLRVADFEDALSWHPIERDSSGAIERAVQGIRPDVALNLGWYAEPGRYLHDAGQNLRSLNRTTQLLEGLLRSGCQRVVLAGTCLEQEPHSSIYAACKCAVHGVAEELSRDGLLATCAHVFYLYGPGEDPRRIVPLVVRALLRKEVVSVSDGSQIRDYLHVADVAEAFCALAGQYPGPSVDICSGEVVPLREVLQCIGELLDGVHLIQFGEHDTRVDGYPSSGDPVPLRNAGWRPAFALEAGLRDTIRFWEAELGLTREGGAT